MQVGIMGKWFGYGFRKALPPFRLANRSRYRTLTFNLDPADWVHRVAGWVR